MVIELQPKEIGRRIRDLRKQAGVTQQGWAQQLAMTAQQLSNYENGRIPDPPFLVRIAEVAGVSVDWLLTGKGAGPRAGQDLGRPPTVIVARSFPTAPDTLDQAQYLAVPVLTEEAAGGPLRARKSKDLKDWAWIRRAELRGRERHRLLGVPMVGDSMDPIIRNGSTLVVDLDDKRVVKRGVYAVVTPRGGKWTVKHLKQSGHLLLLYPANAGTADPYPPAIDLREHPDPIVGRVIWLWQRLV